jgi:hypothetical protein
LCSSLVIGVSMVTAFLITMLLIFGLLGFFWSSEDLVNIVVKTALLAIFINVVMQLMIRQGRVELV